MSGALSIRFGIEEDLSAILELAGSSAEAPRWSTHHYEEILRSSRTGDARRMVCIADLENSVCGFCVVGIVAIEAELESVVVSPNKRREGLGKKLCLAAFAWLAERGAEQVWLEVRESNAAARAFYRSMRFHETGKRRSYYSDPKEDAVVMRAFLDVATHL